MSVIEELSIQGIRSFSSFDAMKLEFFKPLTLIVGHNGSGKTTIIECLKYATTGEMPPNSRGGAFINDPKVAGVSEVKAKLQLRFRNVNQQESIVTRVMQLTQKQHKLELSTLDAVLRTFDPETHLESSISMKCTALNNELPYQLGVSKAILENVIFCHQEDSNWPLSESSVLKKRFDEIFAATGYTKALESLKTICKKLDAEIKLEQTELVHYLDKKTRGQEISESLHSASEERKALENKISSLEQTELVAERQKLEQLRAQIDAKKRLAEKRDSLSTELKLCTVQLQQTEESIDTKLDKPLDELRQMLSQTDEEQIERQRQQQEVLNIKTKALSQKESALVARKESILTDKAMWKHRDTELVNANRDLVAFVAEATAEKCDEFLNYSNSPLVLSMSHQQAQLSASDVEYFRHATIKGLSAAKSELESKELDLKCQKARIEGELLSLKHEAEKMNEQLQFEKGEIAAQAQQTESLKAELGQLHVFDQKRDMLVPKLRALKAQHATWTRKLDQSKEEYENLRQNSRRAEIEAELCKIRSELGTAVALAPVLAQIDLTRRQLGECKSLFSQNSAKLEALASDLQVVSGGCPKKLLEADAALTKFANNKQQLLAKIATLKVDIERSKKQLSDWSRQEVEAKRKLLALGVDNVAEWPEKCSQLRQKTENLNQSTAELISGQQLYSRFIVKARDSETCPLCLRGFADSCDTAALVARLEMMVKSFPQELQMLNSTKRETEDELNKLQGGRSVYEFLSNLASTRVEPENAKIQSFERQLAELTNELNILQERIDIQANEKAQLEEMNDLRTREASIVAEQGKLELLLRELEAQVQHKQRPRSVLELEMRRKQLENTLDDVNAQESAILATLNEMQGQLTNVKAKVSECSTEIDGYSSKIASRDALKERVLFLENALVQKRTSYAALGSTIEDINKKVVPMDAQKQLLQDEERRVTECLKARIDKINSLLDVFEKKHRRVVEYKAMGIDKQLLFLDGELDSLSSEIATIDIEKEEVAKLQVSVANIVQEAQKQRQQLQLNIRFLQLQQEMQAITLELDSTPVVDDLALIFEQEASRKQFISELEMSISGLKGELRQLTSKCHELRQTFDQNFSTASRDYDAKVIKLRTQELARKDVLQYADAVDKAIMEYHARKMNEINKIIHEMWTQTYRGMDIDTVQIRSDNDGASSDSVRSYKYRVVMVKSNVELEMRGRCSAGQKVLTSLIIRLALAETFCLKCGILALDEPTTNLDSENVESLAESLVQVLSLRQNHHNFQLIVITHDEDFMQMLGKSQYADSYYRVFKNERGFSEISNEPIYTL